MVAIITQLRQKFLPPSHGGVSIATVLARENNNFDLLRLLAASAVILGHSYAISPQTGFMDPIQQVLHFNYSGGIAVDLFFFLSGLLVMDSIRRQPSVFRFLLARAARIMPGLFVCLLVTCLLLGPIFTTLPLRDYFRQPATLSYYYTNLALTDIQWRLPGVFTSSPWGLNGSLWTLPLEIRLYLVVAGFGLLRVWRRRWLAHICLGAILLWSWFLPAQTPYFLKNADFLLPVLSFVADVFAAINKDRIPIRGDLALVLAIVAAVVVYYAYFITAFYFCLFYLVLYLFQTKLVLKLRLPGDYSYGVYIYGFVIQQCVSSLQRTPNPHFNFLLSLPLALGAGIVFWHLVERPCLHLYKRLPEATASLIKGLCYSITPSFRIVTIGLGLPLAALSLPLALKLFFPAANPPIHFMSDLKITAFGPDVVMAGQIFNRQPNGEAALWVKVSRPLARDAQITLGGIFLNSTIADETTITAFVPTKLYASAHVLPLYVSEPTNNGIAISTAVDLVVQSARPVTTNTTIKK